MVATLVVGITIATAAFFFDVPGTFSTSETVSVDRGENANSPCISALQVDLDDAIEIDASNQALALIQSIYREDYYHSSISHHHFVRTAPWELQTTLSKFVWSDSVLKEARIKLGMAVNNDKNTAKLRNDNDREVLLIPDVFDEIYIMRPEFDLLDQKKTHYDGNLKIPGICTIRALTYLSGQDATLVALTSGHNYNTSNHTTIVLDFDRELHYVSLRKNNARSEPRVMIKSAMHVILPGTHHLITYFGIALHRTMVFVSRSFRRTFESRSSSDAPSKSKLLIMAIDNMMRSLNKIHMALPLLLIGFPVIMICIAPILYPSQYFPYVAFTVVRFLDHTNNTVQANYNWILIFTLFASWGTLAYRSKSGKTTGCKTMDDKQVDTKRRNPNGSTNRALSFLPQNRIGGNRFRFVLLHIAWVGLCYYIEANAEMANKILLAPLEPSIAI